MLEKIKAMPFLCGLAALGIGITSQLLLTSGFPVWAVILYSFALLLMIFALRNHSSPNITLTVLRPVYLGKWARFGIVSGGCAVVTAGLAFWMFTTSIPAMYPWLTHLISIALLVLAVILLDGSKHQEKDKNHSWTWLEITLLVAIFAIGAFMRLYRFDQIPFGTWYDEADNGLSAVNILYQPGEYLPVYVESTNLPAHFLYLIAISFQFFGVSTLSIRAVSVIFGLGTIAAAYLAGRELFDRRMGLVLAFFLAVSRWDVNWSRIGMHGVSVPFFELLTVGLILLALRRQRLMDYTLAGLSMGFGLCFYTPFRLFPLVICAFLLVLWFFRHNLMHSAWRGFLLLGLGILIATVPVTQYAINHSDTFFDRMRVTSIFEGKTATEGWKAAAQTTRQHLFMFNYQGDRNGRHNLSGDPMLDPISGALMVLGIGLSLWRIRHPASLLLIVWLLLMLTPGIFSLEYESPQSLRAIGSLPAACLLAAVPIQAVWQKWDRWTDKRYQNIFLIPLCLILGVIGILNYHVYFNRQAKSFDSWLVFSTPETIIGKKMAALGSQVDYYVSTFYYQVPTLRFLAPGVPDYQRLETYDHLPIQSDGKKGAILFIDADRGLTYQQAKFYYPNAEFYEHKAPDGTIVLYEINLETEDITAIQGLTASYYPSADWSGTPFLVRKETDFIFDWQDGDPAPFPFSVEWQGVLAAPAYGNYRLMLHSPALVELIIDGVKIAINGIDTPEAQVVLAKGNHTIRLRTVGKEGRFELAWQPPGEEERTIPSSILFGQPVTANGLLGQYYPNENWQAPPAFAQIDPWIHIYYHNQPIPRPYTVEWTGQVNIPAEGLYHFGIESIDESALYIDDRLLIDSRTPNQYQENEVQLSPGLHPIRLRFSDRTGSTHINLYWTPPGSEIETIPQAALFPPQGEAELLKPTPLTETTAPVSDSPGVVFDLPAYAFTEIGAELLWRSGECGSRAGQFQSPHGIALDQAGNVWVADTGNHRLVKINPQGKFLQKFGKPGIGTGRFVQLFDVVVENDGSLVTLDSESPRVLQRFNQAGDYLASFGSELGTYAPRGLGIDGKGILYLADTGGNRVLRLSPSGRAIQSWGKWDDGGGAGQPVSVSAAPDGSVYGVDAVGGMVRKLLGDGSSLSWAAISSSDTLSGPDIAVGANGHLFITDPENQRVVIYTASLQPVGQLRSGEGLADLFSKPVGIALGESGRLYVSDSDLCQIAAFSLPESLLK